MKDEETKNTGRDVFISYASDKGDSTEPGDRQAADNVCAALESRGIRCWIAPRDILGGAAWGKEINAALSKTRVMVLVFTSSADKSNYVELEVHLALKRKIPIIPIQIGDVSPGGALEFLLANRHWIYAHMPPQENELEGLIDAVSNYLGKESKIAKKSKVNEQPETPGKKIPVSEEMPEDVRKIAEKIGVEKVIINDKGFWEADYGDGIKMVYIPEDEFKMGSNDYKDEKPIHTVFLDGYWMGKYEITVKQYMKFVNATKTHYPEWLEQGSKYNINTGNDDYYKKFVSNENHPIVGISWDDAIAYCDWLSTEKNLTFKLPTEAQWEKAARGSDGRKYPWGGNNEPDETLANFAKKIGKTSPVGSYPDGASPYGLLDMAGNVWEWCNDWYGSDYYEKSPERKPQGPDSGTVRVMRGGSWSYGTGYLRCANRSYVRPSYRYYYLGFRLCQDNK
jgi:formylglycine-generating enzyme required for sulfatase activity